MAKESLRVRLGPDLKKRFDDVLESKGISQVKGVKKIASWVVEQDGRFQAHILGQITLTDEELASLFAANEESSAIATLDGRSRGKLLKREAERPGESEEERSSGA